MNAEVTDYGGAAGSIFFDALCPLCRAGQRLIGPIFTRRGFDWRPLQSHGAAVRLRVPSGSLLDEMRVLLPDGRVLGGIDSWLYLFRSVWWLWPLGVMGSLPGIHAFGQMGYGWVARHRYCLGGQCAVARRKSRQRKIPFLDLP